MRLLFLGDVVGRTGRQAVVERAAQAARSATSSISWSSTARTRPAASASPRRFRGPARRRRRRGHARQPRLRPEGGAGVHRAPAAAAAARSTIRPARPAEACGLFKARNGADVLVINAMGLIFMPELGDPFRAVEREVEACGLKQGADAILVDFHAEATSEKQAMGYFLDGRASLRGRHPHACAHRRRARAAGRHRLHVRCRHVRRLRIGAGHGPRTSRSTAS